MIKWEQAKKGRYSRWEASDGAWDLLIERTLVDDSTKPPLVLVWLTIKWEFDDPEGVLKIQQPYNAVDLAKEMAEKIMAKLKVGSRE